MTPTGNRFGELLKNRIGLDMGSVGETAIARAVRLRSAACGAASEAAYWTLLQKNAGEVQALIEAVVVPETWFYRYPESLDALVDVVRERLERRDPIRILSLPCSTGEEPYSIVMALQDAGIAADRITVDAVDVSGKVIDFAQHAIYGSNSFRGDVQGLLRERYFTPSERGQALSARVKGRVRFQQGNLFDPLLLAGSAPYDVVFCRNLLIYFDAMTQERAVRVLKRLTQTDGLLFVGPAEASLLTRQGVPAMGRPNAFAFSMSASTTPSRPRANAAETLFVRAPVPSPRGSGSPSFPLRRSAAVPASNWRPDPTPAPTTAPPPVAAELLRLADLGHLDDALAACERWLASSGPSAEAFYFQGLLHDAAGRPQQAQTGYRKALYLEPTHTRALLQLSALLQSQGDVEGAQRMKTRARRKDRQHG